MVRRYNGRRENRAGKICITVIVMAMLVVMSSQIASLYKKDQQFAAQEASLTQQKQQELERQQELEDYEAYTKTQEYVEDMAKSKLGMVYHNEILFKEQ